MAQQQVLVLFVAALGAHAVILLAGAARLALMMGWADALGTGVAPFLLGAVVKSVAAAIALQLLISRLRDDGRSVA